MRKPIRLSKADFQDKIERLRGELNELADRLGVTSRVVLLKSQELDKQLNEYSLMLGKGE
ncbi:Spo0E family sporulation regulatory protein-aspartic acid phosphatase [Paenibacillus sp. NPDC058071]|uniref:Spo0E family sporulation regulatory protein-aspartic acid phosphatase n=1 Tax=Paenibacillus sp. NPDC058071 TaxID=3346326 RepID=UPI0036DADCB2